MPKRLAHSASSPPRPPAREAGTVPSMEAVCTPEATIAQLQAMQALTDTSLSHLGLDDLLRELLSRLTAVIGVDNVGILLLEEDDQTLTLRAASGVMEREVDRVQGPLEQGFPGRIAASQAPLVVDAPTAADFEGAPPFVRKRLQSLAGVPLVVEEEVEGRVSSQLVGVLVVGSDTPHHFTDTDVQLLQRAADRIALAIDRARLYAAEQDARQRAEASASRAQASEAEAAERAERLKTIMETMTEAVVVTDTLGGLVQVNHAYRELFAMESGPAGYEALPVSERYRLVELRDAATGARLAIEDTPVWHALHGEVVSGPGADVRAKAFDGRELELNNSAAPLRDREGQVEGAVCVVHDVTERNQLAREREAAAASELAARAASRQMEAFLATAAHDLRTPLTATVGYLGLAERAGDRLAAAVPGEASSELARRVAALRRDLTEAHQSTTRLTRLLTLLFDTAAIRAGQLALHRVPCDVAALMREQVAALHVAAPDRTIRLHMPVEDGEPIPVEADADRIAEVVMNYVTNALKYSPPDQPVDIRVTVEVMAHGRRARVAVCDTGPGLPKEERGRVWQLFHRTPGIEAEGGTTSGSLGLGLYICKAIIAAHGGRVGVWSAVGKGSTFWFTLPVADGPSASPVAS